MFGRKPWVRCPPASSDMPSSRWLPSSWRSVSQSASVSSLTFLAPSFSSAGRLDPVGQDRPEGDQVGVDAGVRLRIGVRRAEQLAGVLGGERLDGVDVLAAGVEAVADRALGVLVAEPGAHGQQHGRRGVVLARDQLERAALVGAAPGGWPRRSGARPRRSPRGPGVVRALLAVLASARIGHRRHLSDSVTAGSAARRLSIVDSVSHHEIRFVGRASALRLLMSPLQRRRTSWSDATWTSGARAA